MPYDEPADTLGLWSAVKAAGGSWPKGNEFQLRALADGWRRAGDELTRSGEVDHAPLESGWPDFAGALYRARVRATKAVADGGAAVAGAMAQRTDIYAAEIASAKKDIKTLIDDNLPNYQRMKDERTPPDLVRQWIGQLAAMVEQRIDRAAAVFPAGGGIPDPPAPPEPDQGAAGLDGPLPPKADLERDEAVLRAAVLGVAATGTVPNAVANFAHYLGGEPGDQTNKYILSEDVVEDSPGLQADVNKSTDAAVKKATDEAIANGTFGQPIPFSTQWREFNITPQENKDWFYAIGNVHHQETGTVTVRPPDFPGGKPVVEVAYDVHLYDRYNWDNTPGKAATFLGIPLRDEALGQFQRAGLAQEYDIIGVPEQTHHETREAG